MSVWSVLIKEVLENWKFCNCMNTMVWSNYNSYNNSNLSNSNLKTRQQKTTHYNVKFIFCIKDLKFLRAMIEDDNQFLEVTALGSELAWRVMKLWMTSAGRTLNNYQVNLS